MGLIVSMVAAFGVYYVWFMEAAKQEEEKGASTEVKIEPRLPAGSIMEDGTLPE